MKQLGDLQYFPRIEVAQSKYKIFLSQQKHVLDLLSKTRMPRNTPVDTLIKQNHKLFKYV